MSVTPQVFTVSQKKELTFGVGEAQEPSKRMVFSIGLYIVVLNLLLLYLLLKIWPGTVPIASSAQVQLGWGRWTEITLWLETRYLLIVLVSAALGSYVHLATSFADFLGNRKLVASWAWWYLLRPFIGMALAVVLYFVIRGGLVSGPSSTSGAEILSPYGVAALAGMCGLFSKQATDKLREIFENLFRTEKPTKRADPLREPAETPSK